MPLQVLNYGGGNATAAMLAQIAAQRAGGSERDRMARDSFMSQFFQSGENQQDRALQQQMALLPLIAQMMGQKEQSRQFDVQNQLMTTMQLGQLDLAKAAGQREQQMFTMQKDIMDQSRAMNAMAEGIGSVATLNDSRASMIEQQLQQAIRDRDYGRGAQLFNVNVPLLDKKLAKMMDDPSAAKFSDFVTDIKGLTTQLTEQLEGKSPAQQAGAIEALNNQIGAYAQAAAMAVNERPLWWDDPDVGNAAYTELVKLQNSLRDAMPVDYVGGLQETALSKEREKMLIVDRADKAVRGINLQARQEGRDPVWITTEAAKIKAGAQEQIDNLEAKYGTMGPMPPDIERLRKELSSVFKAATGSPTPGVPASLAQSLVSQGLMQQPPKDTGEGGRLTLRPENMFGIKELADWMSPLSDPMYLDGGSPLQPTGLYPGVAENAMAFESDQARQERMLQALLNGEPWRG